MLSWVHRLWVGIPQAVPYDNLSLGGHTPETGRCQGMETCHRWRFPRVVPRMLKKYKGSILFQFIFISSTLNSRKENQCVLWTKKEEYISHPRHQTWWRRYCMRGSLVQSIWWGTWLQHGQCKCHQSSTCSGQSLQLSQHDSHWPSSSLQQDPWARRSESPRKEGAKQRVVKERYIWLLWHDSVCKIHYSLTYVWSSFSPGTPWLRRFVWPCIAAPQHSPPPCHNPSSSPAGCRAACTPSLCRMEALEYTHLRERQQDRESFQQSLRSGQKGMLWKVLLQNVVSCFIYTDRAAGRGLGVWPPS